MTQHGHYAIITALGKAIRADFKPCGRVLGDIDTPTYWCIWISANSSFTAGTYYRLYADGRFEHWHQYEDGHEERLDHD